MDTLQQIREELLSTGLPEDVIEVFIGNRGGMALAEEYEHEARCSEEEFRTYLTALCNSAWESYNMHNTLVSQQAGEIEPLRRAAHRRSTGKFKKADLEDRQQAAGSYLERILTDPTKHSARPRGPESLNRLLTESEAASFLDSPLNSRYGPDKLRMDKLTGIEEILSVEEIAIDGKLQQRTKINASSDERDFDMNPIAQKPGNKFIYPGGTAKSSDLLLWAISGRVSFIPHPQKAGLDILAKPNSALDKISRRAANYTAYYPILHGDAIWFELTGKFRPSSPVQITYRRNADEFYNHTSLNIEVDGWVSAEEVAAQYRHAQKQVLGKIPRSLGVWDLRIVEFVDATEGKSWKERLALWNKEFPIETCARPGDLSQKYSRASERLACLDLGNRRASTVHQPE